MSVPPEVLKAQMGAGGGAPPQAGGAQPQPGAGAPPGAASVGGMASPSASPMSDPQQKEGLKAAAQVNVHIAMNMLEEALPVFGSESKEGQKIMRALQSLGTLAAKRDSGDLVPAEVLQMARSMPQMGGGTEVQRQIMKQMRGGGGQPQQPQQPQPGA